MGNKLKHQNGTEMLKMVLLKLQMSKAYKD